METTAFLVRLVSSRLVRKTSASSSRRTQPQVCVSSRTSVRFFSMVCGSSPSSPELSMYSGLSTISATASAVRVLPMRNFSVK